MSLAIDKEKKRMRKALLPLAALLVCSLFLSSTVSAIPVYKINNTFTNPDYVENGSGDLTEHISPWTMKASVGNIDSYVGLTSLVIYPNEGMYYKIPRASLPVEFNYTFRGYFLSWPTEDGDSSNLFCMNGYPFNSVGSSSNSANFDMQYAYPNGTYRFQFNDAIHSHYFYVTDNPALKTYTLLAHVEVNSTDWTAHIDYSLCVESDTTTPGDETYYNYSQAHLHTSLSENVYFRVGGYSFGSSVVPGYTWVKYIKLWWDDGISPPEPTGDYSDTSVVIQNLVKQIVFFIPILVLTSFFGRIGFMGGVGLMSIIWIFSNNDFLASGILMLVALGIFTYKGGMQ